ncbi:MAG TPA: phosphotransferase [Streptomyces sp.]|nr:phosphotransferase [Streptomyces sp.]
MTTAPALDRAATRRLLAHRGPVETRALPEGRFNICWHLNAAGRSYLLKLNSREGEPHLQRVADAMSQAAVRGVAVPHVLDVGTDPVLGPYLLQEWLEGETFTNARRRGRITPTVWTSLAQQIARLHTPPVPGTATVTARRRRLAELLDELLRYELLPPGLASAARHRGDLLADQLGEHPLVPTHQDIHPDNILIQPDGTSALLDFDHAAEAEDASDFVKLDRWCLPSAAERRLLLHSYWRERGLAADPLFEQRLAFHRLLTLLSYFLYWHTHDAAQLPGCVTALHNELEPCS